MDLFGGQLRNFRLTHGLTQKDLGSILGYGRHIISDLELEKRLPTPDELEHISSILGWDSTGEDNDFGAAAIVSDDRAKFVFTLHYDDSQKMEEDKSILEEASSLLELMGIDLTDAVRLFLIQVIRQEKLPFEIQL